MPLQINYHCKWLIFALMRLMFFIILTVSLFAFSGKQILASSAGCETYEFALQVNLRPSYVMATHGFYNGWNPQRKSIKTGGTADVQLLASKSGRGVYMGLGAAVHTFGAHDMLGTPATFYILQGAPLARLAGNLTIGYEWNLGLSAGWHNNGIVTVSPVNVYINVAALFDWKLDQHWNLIFGPEYTHFSNGDTRFPNGGANTVNFRIGVRRHFKPSASPDVEKIFSSCQQDAQWTERITYDLMLSGGFRADRSVSDGNLNIFNRAFPVAMLNFNPKYGFNPYLSVGPSLDLIYDRSANLLVSENEDDNPGFEYPLISYQTSMGISARVELTMPVFAVNIGIGYGTHFGNRTRYESPDLNGLYGIFALKAFLTDRLFLNVSYRLSTVLYSHNLMFGIGWRFGNLISHP